MTGFVAGTLVHTEKGLVSIQEIKVEDRVLSQSDEQYTYQPVISTSKAIEKQQLYLLRYIDNYIAPHEDDPFAQTMNLEGMLPSKIYTEVFTNQKIWINEDIDNEINEGWQSIFKLNGGEQITFKDKILGGVVSVDPLMQTYIDQVFFLHTNGDYVSVIVDMRNNELKMYYIAHLVLSAYKNIFRRDEHPPLADYIIIGDLEKHVFLKDIIQFLHNPQFNFAFESVFNIQLDDSSTYFIGKNGLWVHC